MIHALLTVLLACGEPTRPPPPDSYFETCRQGETGSPDCEAGLECVDVGSYYHTVCTYACAEDVDCPEEISGRRSSCADGYCYIEESR